MSYNLSRRQVLRMISFLSAGTAVVGSTPFISKLFADKANAQTSPWIRESIATFAQSPEKLAALKRGIEVMKSRPATDPTSWQYQANIHGTYDTRNLTSWNTCSHGTFFFFSWHRMYLLYFERILRKASGDPNLALPYWNYSDFPDQRALPEPFRIPADSSNPLFIAQRGGGINEGTTILANAEVSYNRAFQLTNFFHRTSGEQSFGGLKVSETSHRGNGKGLLEAQPHGQIHVALGGWMGDINNAARDPIFWLHHANMDRLWERWLQQGGGRENPIKSGDWYNDAFTFFNENGTQVMVRNRNILNIAQQLKYKYDDDPSLSSTSNRTIAPSIQRTQQITQVNTQPPVEMSLSNEQLTIVLSNAPLTLTTPSQGLLGASSSSSSRAKGSTQESTFTLKVKGVEYNPDNYIAYRIFINLPKGATPDPNSPYYAGRLALFSLHQKATFSLDITDVLIELEKNNLMAGNSISVTFVPPSEEKLQNLVTQGNSTQLRGAVRFKGVTLRRQ